MTKRVLFYLFFGSVIICSASFLFKKQTMYIPTDDLISIQSLDNGDYDSITLALEPFKGIMLATNILGNVDLYSVEDSYYPKIEYKPERITTKNPLLTTADSCYQTDAVDFVQLTDSLILISKIKPPEGSVYFFNKSPNCNGLKLHTIRGLSGIEEWGAWSEGEATEFRIEINESYPNGGELLISARPAINPNVKNDGRVVLVEVDGKEIQRFNLTADKLATMHLDFKKKEPGSELSVVLNNLNPMRFSDISGSDSRSVSVGFISVRLASNGGEK